MEGLNWTVIYSLIILIFTHVSVGDISLKSDVKLVLKVKNHGDNNDLFSHLFSLNVTQHNQVTYNYNIDIKLFSDNLFFCDTHRLYILLLCDFYYKMFKARERLRSAMYLGFK
jgi:hypothetical protein